MLLGQTGLCLQRPEPHHHQPPGTGRDGRSYPITTNADVNATQVMEWGVNAYGAPQSVFKGFQKSESYVGDEEPRLSDGDLADSSSSSSSSDSD